MKQQIKKLCKQLSRFNFDEIASILELSDDEVQKIIQDLIAEKVISKISDTEFAYVPDIVSYPQIEALPQKQSPKQPKPELCFDITTLLSDNKEAQELFNNAAEYNKRHIIKCLNLFRLTSGLSFKETSKMLNEITKKNPDYKMGYSTFIRWKSSYARNGLLGLMKAYNPPQHKSLVTKEQLKEFEEIYLTPKNYSVRIAWEILRSRHPNEQISSIQSFRRALTKNFSAEYIKKRRSESLKLPDLRKISSVETDKITYEKVSTAFDDYLKTLENKQDENSICTRGYIQNHLYPYFGKYKFKDITQETLINYQSKMLSEGYSVASIKRFISTFQKIMKKYSNSSHLLFSTQETILPSLENRVLTDLEIQQIIKDDNKIQELWILATGINIAELGALYYTDINFSDKTVNISKFKNKGNIENIRAKYKIRTLKIPDILFNKITKKQNGLLFKDVKIDNFDLLLNTYIKLLLDKNVQINIISRNLGFYKLTDFESRYNFLLPQKLDSNFQII